MSALPAEDGVPPGPARGGRRRGAWLALGGLAVAGAVATALALAITRRGSTAAPATPPQPPPIARAAAAAPPPAAAQVIAIPADATPAPADAGVAAVQPAQPPPPRPSPAELHVRNAEEARRANNRLRQLAEADLALKADPRNQRAKFLLGDALLQNNDPLGCKYLRALRRNPAARSRADAAGCPSDSQAPAPPGRAAPPKGGAQVN